MTAPTSNDLLVRRILASLVDLALVLGIWMLVLYRLAVRFQIAQRTADGRPVYSDFQRQELARIDGGINFGFTLGDYYHSLYGRGLVLGMLGLLVFSLIAWVLVPANTGWSAGHRLLGLKVTDLKGNKPPLDSYLRRYLVGIVDFFPYVIPGLLGWIVAYRTEQQQRMGDLSADTIVVDARGVGDEQAAIRAHRTAESLKRHRRDVPVDDMVDVEDAIKAHTPTRDGEEAVDDGYLEGDGSEYPIADPDEEAIPSIAMSDEFIIEDEPAAGSSFVESIAEHEADRVGGPESGGAAYAPAWNFPEAREAPVWTPEPVDQSAHRGDEEQAAPAIAGEPIWNEDWGAWLYWDAVNHQWLKHDATDGWSPIEDVQNVS